MSDMKEAPVDTDAGTDLPPQLRFLKALVTILSGTMIVGLITIVALIVIRFPTATAPRPALPDGIRLPEGEAARAVTFGSGWIAVVTEKDEILILDADSGALRQRVQISAGE
ncbi:hypothetical protein DEA8626_02198 [Defluviimonas aquaemixtae]|uniref:Uncharacterized protein n=1 Tax=Albidovulum aquaemixtae TaxID=1542388 RepID=A0A2R8B7T5_9RHOB|nr:DUF6476 family protein [Defluviimonas aquaemixtae]SPH18658.1 hypothetical protein DEA8626_02198 [Defluviimonas aquaemixtae]